MGLQRTRIQSHHKRVKRPGFELGDVWLQLLHLLKKLLAYYMPGAALSEDTAGNRAVCVPALVELLL